MKARQSAARTNKQPVAIVPAVFTPALLLCLLWGNSVLSGATASGSENVPESGTYVFVCDDKTAYTVRVNGNHAWIFRPEGTLKLPRISAETGARFLDDAFELWITGEYAKLGKIGNRLHSCKNDRRQAIWEKAKLDGASFRAVGNEPGWYLEILGDDTLILVTDYGATKAEITLSSPLVDRPQRVTRWDTGELQLEIAGRQCTDSMSGEVFASEVQVIWKGKTLRGCGRALH